MQGFKAGNKVKATRDFKVVLIDDDDDGEGQATLSINGRPHKSIMPKIRKIIRVNKGDPGIVTGGCFNACFVFFRKETTRCLLVEDRWLKKTHDSKQR